MKIKRTKKKANTARKETQSVREKSASLEGVHVHAQLPLALLRGKMYQNKTTFLEKWDGKEHADAHSKVEAASRPLHPTKHKHVGNRFFG